ncbi:MAG TPA: tetratricopeptide repeat protein [Longimicrobiaceae bacterium]|jgi:tetratricopeptide (TPR) repeat protein|nr:tetratricopeptide repeat protein [Longimicrobiaceae bacterium]
MEAAAPAPLPLTPEDARALRAAAAWPELAARGDVTDEAALLADPAMGYAVAAASRMVGRTGRAIRLGEQVEAEARRRGDARLAAEAVNLVGNALFEEGRVGEADERFRQLLDYASQADDAEMLARATNNLGILADVRGRRDQALAFYGRALAAFRRAGDVRGLAQTHHNLGVAYRELGFGGEADAHHQRAADLAGGAGLDYIVGLAETGRAILRVRGRDGRLGEAMAERAMERFERLGDPVRRGEALRVMAAAARLDGRDTEAAARLDEALLAARTHANALLRADVQRDRGLLLRDLGDTAAAREALLDSAAAFDLLAAADQAAALRMIAADLDGADDEPRSP